MRYRYSLLDKLLISAWFIGAPIMGLLCLTAAYIASQRPERYPTYPFGFAISAGTMLLTLPVLTIVILYVARHIAKKTPSTKDKTSQKERGEKTIVKNNGLPDVPEQNESQKQRDLESEKMAIGAAPQPQKIAVEQMETYDTKESINKVSQHMCKHKNQMNEPLIIVNGEIRKVRIKCLDCGKILKIESTGR